jgi:hypothetical protein
MADEPLSGLELGQFSLEYEDLPIKEDALDYEDNRIYRSKRSSYVYVYHHPDKWDCFVPK